MIKDERMAAVYSAVRTGVTVYDIGTDHAIIPIELILSGKSNKCVITDISAPSLEKGVKNAKKAHCSEKITAHLANGTLGVPLEAEADFIIAGMGGELIAQIICQDTRLKNKAYHFVLQPMSRAEELRAFLSDGGFEIKSETKIKASGRVYPVICCEYTSHSSKISATFRILGFEKASTELEKEYALKTLKAYNVKLKGLQEATFKDEKQIDELEAETELIRKTLE